MSKRDFQLYVDDIIDSAKAIEDFVQDMEFEVFAQDRKTYSATILESISL